MKVEAEKAKVAKVESEKIAKKNEFELSRLAAEKAKIAKENAFELARLAAEEANKLRDIELV